MEADSPPPPQSDSLEHNSNSLKQSRSSHSEPSPQTEPSQLSIEPSTDTSSNRRLSNSCEDSDADTTIHAFNVSNITVIERLDPSKTDPDTSTHIQCEGSDSGVEVIEVNDPCGYQRTLSVNSGNSQDFGSLTSARSCDSSIISCCSNYEEAYNILVRRNSTLLEDYTLRNDGGTSENGSESSSVTGSSGSRNSKRTCQIGIKKKISVPENKSRLAVSKERSKSKPPVTPRLRSVDRAQNKTVSSTNNTKNNAPKKETPSRLELKIQNNKRDTKTKPSSARTPSTTRTPTLPTPTDDGRWPSINSKPAPLMSRSLRGILDAPALPKTKPTQMETKTIEKYATLPRRRKDKPDAVLKDVPKKPKSRESSINRLSVPKRPPSREQNMQATKTSVSREPNIPSTKALFSHLKKRQKVKIYHEANIQTALTLEDLEKALFGQPIDPVDINSTEKCDKDVQVDFRLKDIEQLQEQLKVLNEKYESLNNDYKLQSEKLKETEDKLRGEQIDKEGLSEELKRNKGRVLAILGEENSSSDGETTSNSDSLMVLESRFQNVSQVVIQQEEEISKLNALCRSLQLDLEKSVAAQRTLLQQHQDLEAESIELQEFMQAEKTTLTDALKEAETEISKCRLLLNQKDNELQEKQEECKHLVRLSEQRRQENMALQAKLGAMECKSRELLVHQGSSVSGASVAISALIGRLDGLVEELVNSYSISEQELEDVIFHNEAYSNSSSSPDATPEKLKKFYLDRTPSPKKGSSFVAAVINAIRNAAAQSPFAALKDSSRDGLCTENSSSNEMLDSETEPCLMMEHVLEDVIIPDGHSHNMISSGHGMLGSRLTHSESLKDLSQAILNRQMSEQASLSYAGSLTTSFTSEVTSLTDLFPSISLVDQVIDVDNLITRLLKVIRIIQMENEDCMNELQEQRDNLSEQVNKQKETNKVVVKQLKDWEVLGARLKTEVKELMQQLSRKNNEIDKIKAELNNQREQVEKLNQDVCELSTALAKSELEMKEREEAVTEAIKNWEKTGENPAVDVLGKLILAHNEIPSLKEKLSEKERYLSELTQEFLASRQVLTESLKEAVTEAKKQYEAIDNALEVLHSIQSVVQQCPPLATLQRELEETSFKSASKMPFAALPDCNANAALLQAMANLEITSPINTTA